MTISELIERLEALKAEHGDIVVKAYDCGNEPSLWEVSIDDVYVPGGSNYVMVSP